MERYRSKLAALDPAAREAVDAITQGVVNKLLHEPTIRVKDAAGHRARGAVRRRAGRLVRSPGVPTPTTTADAQTRDAWERVGASLAGRTRRCTSRRRRRTRGRATTSGDQRTDVPIHELGGTGIFVKEVQQAVLDGRADLALHSAKDLPALTPDGLVLAPCPNASTCATRSSARRSRALPVGARSARVGTTSGTARGRAPRPDVRGITRQRRHAPRQGIGARRDRARSRRLDRLGLGDRITERLDTALMLPMVGQGALAVECRADDASTLERLAAIDDPDAHAAVEAERAFLAELGGGCSLPCAASRPWISVVT
jgi:hypothetical protein